MLSKYTDTAHCVQLASVFTQQQPPESGSSAES